MALWRPPLLHQPHAGIGQPRDPGRDQTPLEYSTHVFKAISLITVMETKNSSRPFAFSVQLHHSTLSYAARMRHYCNQSENTRVFIHQLQNLQAQDKHCIWLPSEVFDPLCLSVFKGHSNNASIICCNFSLNLKGQAGLDDICVFFQLNNYVLIPSSLVSAEGFGYRSSRLRKANTPLKLSALALTSLTRKEKKKKIWEFKNASKIPEKWDSDSLIL